ncbi:MAG: hypothetical protein A3J30_04400 [Candidatus Wildermuthbacteria bacterium RIFCSPLOWO2_02_FULL_47_9c]|uniref:peptide chain release factor N(5)-glutamine methyltransferase n=1 Tax=Candidatus Wildermuthbacteria bacterium RIFCSPLOWO2_02_FULL_47_9c TaxID=1802466 RepID=A0A1G2RWL8_9BACT|nr:MAG: hypothetical protein A2109_03585 [Candidatus Wildermuthbacteria bacterium GWA1_49_26]OHA75098.1 MAG: hypothetical protein A3B28_01725 [Candidatus Wildermuthbacteria bacterium RIFCSPLOWO2_01_FULL_50_46]OHA77203.1 MAG: hypothetical protein A3J30_04400 [Candidatus Wildermuthbacteria bacterium RIFCSPLOWO2_02_FULL_47_9c]OHA78420.1 MAG: hypothetical protein A3G10_00170 [Candidatus Wildermuthbacteria bacterium RIFCSPLOWO2_12_FULL_49_9]
MEEKHGGKRTEAAEKDIARLEKGEHIDYVIGWVEFLGCKIDLSQKPLIPRPETEYWTEKFLQDARAATFPGALPLLRSGPSRLRKSRGTHTRCLDLFAGSGCVGIAVLKHMPWATVDFAEKEKKFLKQIQINAKLNEISNQRYRVIQSNIFSKVRDKYDYILANPPYVAEERRACVQKSVLEHEPASAVFGGKDGLLYIRPFLQQAKNYLKEGGELWMEFDSPQKTAVEKLLKQYRYRKWRFEKDQYARWRYFVVQN